jgi:hypothetical protein
MAEVFYESFGPKNRHDRASRNVTIGSLLAHLGAAFGSALVFLDTDTPGSNPDTVLTFENGGVMLYNSATKTLSFIENAGTPGAKYLVTVRVTLADGRRYDESFWQEVI